MAWLSQRGSFLLNRYRTPGNETPARTSFCRGGGGDFRARRHRGADPMAAAKAILPPHHVEGAREALGLQAPREQV
jgi:hypothetical protein